MLEKKVVSEMTFLVSEKNESKNREIRCRSKSSSSFGWVVTPFLVSVEKKVVPKVVSGKIAQPCGFALEKGVSDTTFWHFLRFQFII